MPKRAVITAFAAVALNPNSPVPLYRQLYDELRQAILSGRLAAGTRLPSTRLLANELSISRNTVVNTFDQLMAEGYLESWTGDGTYVTQAIPDDLLRTATNKTEAAKTIPKGRVLSQRGKRLATIITGRQTTETRPTAFRTGVPAFETFPFDVWARLEAQHWRVPAHELLTYGEPAGYWPLREAIAAYLREARAVRCTPEQVIIVSGSQQAFDLASRVLLDPDDTAWIENPGYVGVRAALLAAGARLIPVPIDAEGLDIAAGIKLSLAANSDARLVYVSPSHQHPIGVTMSLARRLALLKWANRTGAWVLEDDYDSEYRYASRPLAALQGLDRENRVIYVGTFSKVLIPALRLGYLVSPPDLVDAFVSARAIVDRHSPLRDQAVLADFITGGSFARHIRRMRALYAERQAMLVEAAQHYLAGWLELAPADAGMHLTGWLAEGTDDRQVSRRALALGVDATPLSFYSLEPLSRGGLVLGYAALNKAEIDEGVRQLAKLT